MVMSTRSATNANEDFSDFRKWNQKVTSQIEQNIKNYIKNGLQTPADPKTRNFPDPL